MIWHNAAKNPPPTGAEVILALRSEPKEGTVGYRLPSGDYRLMDQVTFGPADVYAWTELPKPPAPESLGLTA